MFQKDDINNLRFKINMLENRLQQIEEMEVSINNGEIKPVSYCFDGGRMFKVPTAILIKLIFDHLGLVVKYNPYGQWSLEKKDG
jgi:hypothetical protein